MAGNMESIGNFRINNSGADSGNIINLLKTTGKPLKLTHKGIMIAFVCDPNVYRHIEERRRNLEKLLLGEPASFVSTIGRRPMLSASEKVFRDIKCCILKIESLKSSINSKACELYSLKEELEKTEELFESIPTPEGHACQKTKKS